MATHAQGLTVSRERLASLPGSPPVGGGKGEGKGGGGRGGGRERREWERGVRRIRYM